MSYLILLMKKSNPLQEIEKLAGGDKQTKKELIRIFIHQTSQRVTEMNSYMQSNDWDELKRTAHKMKSSFLYLNMARPIELTDFLMETSGIDIKTTAKHINELSVICLQVISELKSDTIK